MIDLKNPETIEIHGYKTIHKLCNFAADRNLEGSTFTEIVEHAFDEINALKEKLAKVESGEFVVVPREPTDVMINTYRDASVAPISTLSIRGYKAMIKTHD